MTVVKLTYVWCDEPDCEDEVGTPSDDGVRAFVRGLSWQEVVLLVVGVLAFVAFCFSPAATCSMSIKSTESSHG